MDICDLGAIIVCGILVVLTLLCGAGYFVSWFAEQEAKNKNQNE